MGKKEKSEKSFSIIGALFTLIKIICIIILLVLVLVLGMQRFSNNEKSINGYRVFNVATGSMIPVYEVGDVLIVKEVDTDTLEVDDDITYLGKVDSFAGRVVTHRIIAIEETEDGKVFTTKGVANTDQDPTITADQIYGKVIYKCQIISLFTKLMNNMTAFFIVIFIPFAILIFLQIKDFADRRKEEIDDLDEDQDDDEYEDEDDLDEDDDDDDDEYEYEDDVEEDDDDDED